MPNCKEHRGCYLVCECSDGYYCFLEEHVPQWHHVVLTFGDSVNLHRLVWVLRATLLDPAWRATMRQEGLSAGDRAAYEIEELLEYLGRQAS